MADSTNIKDTREFEYDDLSPNIQEDIPPRDAPAINVHTESMKMNLLRVLGPKPDELDDKNFEANLDLLEDSDPEPTEVNVIPKCSICLAKVFNKHNVARQLLIPLPNNGIVVAVVFEGDMNQITSDIRRALEHLHLPDVVVRKVETNLEGLEYIDPLSCRVKKMLLKSGKWTYEKSVCCEVIVRGVERNIVGRIYPIDYCVVPAHLLLSFEQTRNLAGGNGDISGTRHQVEDQMKEEKYVFNNANHNESIILEPPPLLAYRLWDVRDVTHHEMKPEDELKPEDEVKPEDGDRRYVFSRQNTAFMNDIALLKFANYRPDTSADDTPLFPISEKWHLEVLARRKQRIVVGDFEGRLIYTPEGSGQSDERFGLHLAFTITSKDSSGKTPKLTKGSSGLVVFFKGKQNQLIPVGMLVGALAVDIEEYDSSIYQAIVLSQALKEIHHDYSHRLADIQLLETCHRSQDPQMAGAQCAISPTKSQLPTHSQLPTEIGSWLPTEIGSWLLKRGMEQERGEKTLRHLANTLLTNLNNSDDVSSGTVLSFRQVQMAYTSLISHLYPSKYEFNHVIRYLKQKSFITCSKETISFAPFFVGEVSGGLPSLFVLRSRFGDVSNVCEICQRGFATKYGLIRHLQKARTHKLGLEEEIANITTSTVDDMGTVEYRCPFLNCQFVSTEKAEVEKHLKRDKTKKVNISTLTKQTLTTPTLAYCELCDVKLPAESLSEHESGLQHRQKALFSTNYIKRKWLMFAKQDVQILVNGEHIAGGHKHIITGDNSLQLVKFGIENMSPNRSVTLSACKLLNDIPAVLLFDKHSVCRDDQETDIPANRGRYEVQVNFRPTCLGRTVVPLLFTFRCPPIDEKFEILREITIESVSNPTLFTLLQPKTPYVKRKRERIDYRMDIVESDFLPTFKSNSSLVMTLKPDPYFIPHWVRGLLQMANPEETKLRELNLQKLDFSNYSTFFNNLLYAEEYQMEIDIHHYTMHGRTLNKDSRNGLLRLVVPGLAENRPSVLRGDTLYAIPDIAGGTRKYEGQVHNVTLTEVFVGFARSMRDSFISGMKYKIEFTINRLTLKVAHRGVSWAGEMTHCYLKDVLFPTSDKKEPLKPGNPDLLPLKFSAVEIEESKEQQTAVRHIVAGTSRPAPYLIYGPPGTGKTFTLVEAIKQVYKEFPDCRILACAPQNAAADLVTERLLGYIDKRHLLRVHAMSRNYNDVEEKIRDVSNYKTDMAKVTFGGGDREIWLPSKEELQKYKVLVVTLVTSGRFVSAEMGNHFTHIFIDEAGHATEPETVIPLAGLLDVNMTNGGQVVLAGDPQQLGPVIRSSVASQGGLGKSLLERLMNTDVYKRQRSINQFDPNFVTKLVQSFRSHPDILKVPNDCFYESELEVCAEKLKTERFCHWEGLPMKGFPLIFHGVNGEEQREEPSPSWFNVHEAAVVQGYVRMLMECKSPTVTNKDIGIISPYHQQVKKIKEAMRRLEHQTVGRQRDFEKIKVGSVEKFQGDEKEVIIISTVRSQDANLVDDEMFNLGFVRNPKRFNVAVTRSKALLIVVGNPAILAHDSNWRKLIRHIRDGGGYTGCPLPANIDSDIDDLEEELAAVTIEEEKFGPNESSAYQQMIDDGWDANTII